jgi:hypothetical protein
MAFKFESAFSECVASVGGQRVTETVVESADFLFPTDNVIAELKTLQDDARRDHAMKLQSLVIDWRRRGLLVVFGRTAISLRRLNPTCQREWLRILQKPIEAIVRKANRQIRSTKKLTGRPDSKGLLIIANDGNFLHTSPQDYMILVARVLGKKDRTGGRRFSHINGVIYFSYRIRSSQEGLPFWFAGCVEPSADVALAELQGRLKHAWYSQVSKATGQVVTELLMGRIDRQDAS